MQRHSLKIINLVNGRNSRTPSLVRVLQREQTLRLWAALVLERAALSSGPTVVPRA